MSQNLWFAEPADHDGTALPLRTSSHAQPQPDALTESFRRGCLAHSPPKSKVKARLSCGREMLFDKFSQRLVGAHPKDRAGETRRFESGSHKQPEIIHRQIFVDLTMESIRREKSAWPIPFPGGSNSLSPTLRLISTSGLLLRHAPKRLLSSHMDPSECRAAMVSGSPGFSSSAFLNSSAAAAARPNFSYTEPRS